MVNELHRSKPWLERYSKEGIKGLRNKLKSGTIAQIPLEVSARIRKTLRESRQGWTTEQVNDLIVKESGIPITVPMSIDYCINGVSNRKYHEEYM